MVGVSMGVITMAIDTVTSSWKAIANAFKTTESSTIKSQIKGVGFSSFSKQTDVTKFVRIEADKY
jgi:hypothetical protein